MTLDKLVSDLLDKIAFEISFKQEEFNNPTIKINSFTTQIIGIYCFLVLSNNHDYEFKNGEQITIYGIKVEIDNEIKNFDFKLIKDKIKNI